jgi:hypothetical protein
MAWHRGPTGVREQGMSAVGFPRNLGGVRHEGGRRDDIEEDRTFTKLAAAEM